MAARRPLVGLHATIHRAPHVSRGNCGERFMKRNPCPNTVNPSTRGFQRELLRRKADHLRGPDGRGVVGASTSALATGLALAEGAGRVRSANTTPVPSRTE